MRKFFFLIACAFASFLCAENVVTIQPKTVYQGEIGWADDENPLALEVMLNNDSYTVNIITMEILLPKGIEFDMQYDDESEGLYFGALTDEDNQRFKYKSGPKTNKTGHRVDYNRYSEEGDYVVYKIVVSQGTNLTPIQGTSGKIFDIYYTVAADMPDGVYPVITRKIDLVDAQREEKITIPYATSYIKVGNPSSSSLALTGEIPSLVNAALANETAISTLDLTSVTASNGTFTYVPGRNVVAPTSEVKGNVSATVAPKAGSKYATVCLPFAADIDCFTFDAVNGEYASFSEKTTLAANTPALVNKSVTATAENVALGAATTEVKTSGYYVKNDEFCSVNGSATIPALRGWWDINQNVRGFVIDGEETSINAIDGSEAETIYSVAGVRLNKAQRGVNIVNGKKVVIK